MRIRVVAVSVCVAMCVSVKSTGASVLPENADTHSAGNEGQKICGVFSETVPSLGWPYIRLAIFFWRLTCMRIVHKQVLQRMALYRKLSLHSLR